MTTKHLAILFVVLAAGMSAVFALPRQLGYQPVGIDLRIPEFLGEWWGKAMDISQKERNVLGHETEFARRLYANVSGDTVLASIVLSGQDMMTSIHRPERCLVAQGWQVGAARKRAFHLPEFGALETTRLVNAKEYRTPDGSTAQMNSICYYWFIGHSNRAATHEERVWLDMCDRIFKGYSQRWAMVMISAEVTKDRQKFGRDERQVDALLEDFIKRLAPRLQPASATPSLASAAAAD
jgi:EpsI family protein